ncbi:hypothetical protein FEM48_Zijuj04G0002900 [Ziziphus jujuba var. spinosa]|uniref:Uncharacterized protein n=1 Tax=Ziziphus jujuba var. spinosa TaxID=714518 RepID=A0A978VGQ9_ZIZJJ|nr:hypothetical protein FEM48_Zijuj04G0002900 [Ziziphus jujuba var. spinosa]
MEKEGKSLKGSKAAAETDFVLQWGNRKRLRCLKVKKDQNLNPKPSSDSLGKKKIPASRAVTLGKDSSSIPQRLNKNCGSPMNNRKSSVTSPEKEDRYYTTRGSLGLDENGKVVGLDDHRHGHAGDEGGGFVWPKLFISLSSKEKEEDFMAMKGCKLPQRPKKRAKLLQRSLLVCVPDPSFGDARYMAIRLVPGKRPRGLKAMGSMDSDSE